MSQRTGMSRRCRTELPERDCMQQSKEGQERAKPLILLVPGVRHNQNH
jgi:hypothetical protein